MALFVQESKNGAGEVNPHPQLNLADRGSHISVDLKGRPVDKAKTGGWKALPFIFGLMMAEGETSIVLFTLNTYLFSHMHQSPAKAAVIVSNVSGTFFLLTLAGGFIADSYLGAFWTIVAGFVTNILGLSLLTFTTAYSGLQPPRCKSDAHCEPAGSRYMAPLYVALYTLCVGEGLVKANLIALGANQFDDSIPLEKKQGAHYFRYVFFFLHFGLFIATFPGPYLLIVVNPSWAYGASLMLYITCCAILLLGAFKYRHQPPSGSFLTRIAQVFTAALLKSDAAVHRTHSSNLYDPPVAPGSISQKLDRTNKLKFLDRAAAISGADDKEAATQFKSWRLCSVTQVEETKRILQLLPFWLVAAFSSIIVSQITTFTVQASTSLDRRIGAHFVVPAPCMSGFYISFEITFVIIYDKFVVPFVQKFTKNPYGFKPLQRIGVAVLFATLTIIVSALVERKRLSYVRDRHLQDRLLGSFVLPMKVWWLLPQYAVAALYELNLQLSSYEFYYRETSSRTRSIASAFYWSAFAMGFYFSSILVNLVNSITRHHKRGSWLEQRLNDGGLENFYWLLGVLLAINALFFYACASRYQYKYEWTHTSQEPVSAEIID